MSIKTALASCWDICKYNCTNSGHFFGLEPWNRALPEFKYDLYETYYNPSYSRVYPYTQKPASSHWVGLTEVDDQLVSSFLGWLFAIPEMLVWLAASLDMALISIITLLGGILMGLLTPLFIVLFIIFEDDTIKNGFGRCKYTLKDIFEFLKFSASFAFLALLRVPFHLIKALIRIPVGIARAIREIFFSTQENFNAPEDQLAGEGNQRERSRIIIMRNEEIIRTLASESAQREIEWTEVLEPMRRHIELMRERTEMARERLERLEVNNDLNAAINASLNLPQSASIQITPTSNWCEEVLDNLKITDRPPRYTCAISGCLMNPPFLTGDGQRYDENSIKTQFQTRQLKSPLTNIDLSWSAGRGIVLEGMKDEIASFALALSMNTYLDKLKTTPRNGVKEVLMIAENISEKAGELHEQINTYIKQRHLPGMDLKKLASNMVNDENLPISETAIQKAFFYISSIVTGKSDGLACDTITQSSLGDFFAKLKLMARDPLFDNLIISALREAMLEEQKIYQEFENTWKMKPTEDALFAKLNFSIPTEKPENLHTLANTIRRNSYISDKVLQYTLALIENFEKTGSFDQFKFEHKEKHILVHQFLDKFYQLENPLLRTIFLTLLKETILLETPSLNESFRDAPQTKASFDPVLSTPNLTNSSTSTSIPDSSACGLEEEEFSFFQSIF